MRPELLPVTDGPRAASDTCPRCGSAEVRRLSLIHQAGLPASTTNGAAPAQSALVKSAAPPALKRWLPWAVLTVAAFVVVIVSLREELPPFYQKRGYVESGTSPFPLDVPTKIPCHFINMSKPL